MTILNDGKDELLQTKFINKIRTKFLFAEVLFIVACIFQWKTSVQRKWTVANRVGTTFEWWINTCCSCEWFKRTWPRAVNSTLFAWNKIIACTSEKAINFNAYDFLLIAIWKPHLVSVWKINFSLTQYENIEQKTMQKYTKWKLEFRECIAKRMMVAFGKQFEMNANEMIARERARRA